MRVEPGQQCDHELERIGRHRVCRDCAAVYAAIAGPKELVLLGHYSAVRALLDEYRQAVPAPGAGGTEP